MSDWLSNQERQRKRRYDRAPDPTSPSGGSPVHQTGDAEPLLDPDPDPEMPPGTVRSP